MKNDFVPTTKDKCCSTWLDSTTKGHFPSDDTTIDLGWDSVMKKLDSIHEEIKQAADSILNSQNERIELLEKQIKGI